ncbi:MAG: RimK family protein [Pseudomonadales bacterium]|nr:RimK family protein [Pseudomonadales bacterium]
MSKVLIVVDNPEDWEPYHPSDQVITFEQYLRLKTTPDQKVRVINLCRDYGYLSEGYYCSLLSEARGHHVIPPIKVLTDVSSPLLYQLNLNEVFSALDKLFKKKAIPSEFVVKSYFGQVSEASLKPLARFLFERFPCPILELTLRNNGSWEIADLRLVSHRSLSEQEEDAFSEALDNFSREVWRPKKARKSSRYDLAILANPNEQMPPSNPAALKKFVHAGKNLGVNVDIIGPDDLMRLPNYDALFIRETTSIEHHTYRFALKGESAGLVVIDDPTSILRCTNKIYLANLFEANNVPTPKTLIIHRDKTAQLDSAIEELGLPMVIKIPDGSFSRGMAKVNTREELYEKATPLFEKSSLILAQEFLYTDFDWRIGILNNKPLYACRYFMVKNHWQIYRHNDNEKSSSGGFETLPTFEVPRAILQAALKATKPIGDGFYGVDIKESGGKGYVIEVNDNPSIETAVEDRYLGNELYSIIMQEFVRRIEER